MARPIVDILLVVPESADEARYAPHLQAAGYVLRIREPECFDHRLFTGPDTDINLHVFSSGAAEVERMLALPGTPRPGPAAPVLVWLGLQADATEGFQREGLEDVAAGQVRVDPADTHRQRHGRAPREDRAGAWILRDHPAVDEAEPDPCGYLQP